MTVFEYNNKEDLIDLMRKFKLKPKWNETKGEAELYLNVKKERGDKKVVQSIIKELNLNSKERCKEIRKEIEDNSTE